MGLMESNFVNTKKTHFSRVNQNEIVKQFFCVKIVYIQK